MACRKYPLRVRGIQHQKGDLWRNWTCSDQWRLSDHHRAIFFFFFNPYQFSAHWLHPCREHHTIIAGRYRWCRNCVPLCKKARANCQDSALYSLLQVGIYSFPSFTYCQRSRPSIVSAFSVHSSSFSEILPWFKVTCDKNLYWYFWFGETCLAPIMNVALDRELNLPVMQKLRSPLQKIQELAVKVPLFKVCSRSEYIVFHPLPTARDHVLL